MSGITPRTPIAGAIFDQHLADHDDDDAETNIFTNRSSDVMEDILEAGHNDESSASSSASTIAETIGQRSSIAGITPASTHRLRFEEDQPIVNDDRVITLTISELERILQRREQQQRAVRNRSQFETNLELSPAPANQREQQGNQGLWRDAEDNMRNVRGPIERNDNRQPQESFFHDTESPAREGLLSQNRFNEHNLRDCELTVHVNQYRRISQISLDKAKSVMISIDDTGALNKIKLLKEVLDASQLLELVLGVRPHPIKLPGNASGYSKSSIIETVNAEGIYSTRIVEADDCYRYSNEKHLAFSLLMLMVHSSLHHIIENEMKDKDPIRVYQRIVNYFDGHLLHHIETAKQILESHRFGSGPIALSISELREKLRNFEMSQESATTGAYKMGLLDKIMKDERRPAISGIYTNARFNRLNFEDTLVHFIEHATMHQDHHTLAVMTPGLDFCFNFQRGLCKKENCKFQHVLMTEQQKIDCKYDANRKLPDKPQGKFPNNKNKKNAMKNNNSNGTNGMHNNSNNNNNNNNNNNEQQYYKSRPLSKEHLLQVGSPAGKYSAENKEGYSNRQKNIMNALFAYDDSHHRQQPAPPAPYAGDNPFSSWSTSSTPPYPPVMNMSQQMHTQKS